MEMCSLQLLCPGSPSPTQTASHYSWHHDTNLQVKMSLRKCHTFVLNLRAIQRNSSHHSIPQNSSPRSIRHHSNHRSTKCQWDMSVQIPEIPSLISSFQVLRDQFSMFCPNASLWHLWFLLDCPLDCPLDFPLFSLLSPLPSLLDHDLLFLPLPRRLLARQEKINCIDIHGIRVSTSARVARLGITNSQAEFRLHVRHDVQARILECSQAIRIEYRVFLHFFEHQCLKTSELDLVVQLVLHLLLVARHVGLPPFDPRLEFQKRAPSRRNDRAQKVSFPSVVGSYRFLQSPPCLQQILPRVGDNVIRLITRESHECCVHLLQPRFGTPLSSFVYVGKNSRSLSICLRRKRRGSTLTRRRHQCWNVYGSKKSQKSETETITFQSLRRLSSLTVKAASVHTPLPRPHAFFSPHPARSTNTSTTGSHTANILG